MEHIWVPEQKISRLLHKFNFLAKKAAKNGLAPPTCKLTEDTKTHRVNLNIPDDLDTKYYYRPKSLDVELVKVEIDGDMPVFSGWKFLASIQHNLKTDHLLALGKNPHKNYIHTTSWLSERENMIVDSQREYLRDCPADCQHCDLPRNRNQTFLLENENTGELKQVGSSCIDDFLGQNSLRKALWYYELEEVIRHNYLNDYVDNVFSSNSYSYPVPTELILALASLEIDAEGFFSRADANAMGRLSTSDKVRNCFSDPTPMHKALFDAYVEGTPHKQLDKALEVKKFYMSVDDKGKEFIRGAKKLIASDVVNLATASQVGILSFLPEGYRKEIQRKIDMSLANGKGAVNEHFGEVGQRGMLKLKAKSSYENYDAKFPFVLYNLHDDDGREFIWQTSSNFDAFSKGKSYQMKATIKEHGEYRGAHQTALKSVRDIEEVSPSAKPPQFDSPPAKKSKPKARKNQSEEPSGLGL